jgi:hypothetical protein
MLQIRRHVGTCPGCAREYEALRRVKSLLATAPTITPSEDPVTAVMRRWSQQQQEVWTSRHPSPADAPRWSWPWKWMSGPPRWHRYGLAISSGCLAVAIAVTAVALRTPKDPDALAANFGPLLSRPEETFRLDAHVVSESWGSPVPSWRISRAPLGTALTPGPPEPWWATPTTGVSALLVSDSDSRSLYRGR